MGKILVTIEAANHAEYKDALSMLATGIGAADLHVETTATNLNASEALAAGRKPPKTNKTEKAEKPEGPTSRKPETAKVTVDTIRDLAYVKNKTNKDDVKKLIKSYGVKAFSELPEATLFGEFFEKLSAIGTDNTPETEEDDDDFMS